MHWRPSLILCSILSLNLSPQFFGTTGEPAVFAVQLCAKAGFLYLGGYPGPTAAFTPNVRHHPSLALALLAPGSLSIRPASHLPHLPHTLSVPPRARQAPGSAFYAASVTGLSAGGSTLAAPFSTPAILDTGAEALYLEQAVYDGLVASYGAPRHDAVFWAAFGVSARAFFAGPDDCYASALTPTQLNAALPPLVVTFAGNVSVSAPAVN